MPDLSGLRYLVKTFGCQMNLFDSELVCGLMEAANVKRVEEVEDADIVIFMTCCVRENADTRVFGQIASMKNLPIRFGSQLGTRLVAVGGCIGQRDGGKLIESFPNIDVVFGTHNIEELPELLAQAIACAKPQLSLIDDRVPYDSSFPTVRESRFQAWLPIMKGCNNFCSYCIVPYVRGREMSRSIEEVIADAQTLVDDGVREITLLGQNVNSYGRDIYGNPRFAELLRAVGETGIERLRFLTSHPKDLTDETIEAMATVDSIMPFLHLPVQSGSDKVLADMNRRYTAEHYLGIIDKLKAAVPSIAFSTDIIVGYPTETEADFLDTMAIVDEVGYSQAFTFIYSKREGTPAAEMENVSTREEIQDRFDRLVEVVQRGAYDANQVDKGKVVKVLVEGLSKRDETKLSGRSEKNQTVHFDCPADIEPEQMVGRIVEVRVDLARTWYLSGELVGQPW